MTGVPVAALEVVGTDYLNEVARAHWRKLTAKTINTTVAETDLLNGEVTIDAGAMSTNRKIRLVAAGDWLQNSGGPADLPRFKVKLGGTTLLDTNTSGLATLVAAGATRYTWDFTVEIANLGAANAQWAKVLGVVGFASAGNTIAAPTTFVTGEGAWIIAPAGTAQGRGGIALGGGSGAIDTTLARLLELTVILPISHASCEIVLKRADVEVV